MDQNDNQYKCLVHQIKHMSFSYLIFSFLDLLLISGGDLLDNPNDSLFICAHDWFVLPRNDGGAVFLLADGLLLTLFTLNLSHIFYILPNKYGLLIRNMQNLSQDKIDVA
jgi:hypothetical protein